MPTRCWPGSPDQTPDPAQRTAPGHRTHAIWERFNGAAVESPPQVTPSNVPVAGQFCGESRHSHREFNPRPEAGFLRLPPPGRGGRMQTSPVLGHEALEVLTCFGLRPYVTPKRGTASGGPSAAPACSTALTATWSGTT